VPPSPLALVKLTSLCARTRGRADVAIALVDGPVAADGPAFAAARVREIGGRGGAACARGDSLACQHGTFVAAMLVAARDSGAPGIAPDCTLLVRPIFSEGAGADGMPSTTPDELAAAIRDALAAGARIINLSLALVDAGGAAAGALGAALDEAEARGVLVVAATGNRGAVGGSALTRHPAVVPVGACDPDGRPMPETDLARSIGERGLLAPGDRVTSLGGDGRPATRGGSSVAAPFVSGAAALLWSLFPNARARELRRALLGAARPRQLVPPLFDAEAAYRILSKTGAKPMSEPESRIDTPAAVPPPPAVGAAPGTVHAAGCGCASCSGGAADSAQPVQYSLVYALGRLEPRFPTIGIEKEYAQARARGDGGAGKTDHRSLADTISDGANRYLARQLCWVFTVEGLPTYLVRPRDPADLDLLIGALRPSPRPTDVDVLIGLRGPMAPPEACNGLVVPVVVFDQLYSFDVDGLIKSIPKPDKISAADFAPAAEELFFRIQQLADNAGAVDEHRAVNYLAVRYPAIYTLAADAFGRNYSLTAVETRPSRLSGARRVLDVIFTFTGRATDVQEKHFVRVDATEEFPFLVSKLSPYYDR
jgi:hypothetical protein